MVGFIFGIIQMALYLIYKNFKVHEAEEQKLPDIVKPNTIKTSEMHRVCSLPIDENVGKAEVENVQEKVERGEKEEDVSYQV